MLKQLGAVLFAVMSLGQPVTAQTAKYDPTGTSLCVPVHGSAFRPGAVPEAFVITGKPEEKLRSVKVEIVRQSTGQFAGSLTLKPDPYAWGRMAFLPSISPHVFEFDYVGEFRIFETGSAIWWRLSNFPDGADQWVVYYLDCTKVE